MFQAERIMAETTVSSSDFPVRFLFGRKHSGFMRFLFRIRPFFYLFLINLHHRNKKQNGKVYCCSGIFMPLLFGLVEYYFLLFIGRMAGTGRI